MIRWIAILALGVCAAFAAGGEKKSEQPAPEPGETVETPFGPVKQRAVEPRPAPKPGPDPLVQVTVEGETAVFRRQTPFGAQVWKKPVAELTDAEREQLDASRSPAEDAAQEPAGESAPRP